MTEMKNQPIHNTEKRLLVRPCKNVRGLDEVLREIETSQGGEQYSQWAREKLFDEFIHHATIDPESVRSRLERPSIYDLVLEDRTVVKSYRGLPVSFVLRWVKACPDWRQEPVICSQIADWQRSLPVLRNHSGRAKYLKALKEIDPELVPEDAHGAGVFGVDEHLYERWELLFPVLKQLHQRYLAQEGSLYGSSAANRRKKIRHLYQEIVAEKGLWYDVLSELSDQSKLDVEEAPPGVIDYLGQWLPDDVEPFNHDPDEDTPQASSGWRPETVESLCYRKLSAMSGLSTQTVKNALKRYRAQMRSVE